MSESAGGKLFVGCVSTALELVYGRDVAAEAWLEPYAGRDGVLARYQSISDK